MTKEIERKICPLCDGNCVPVAGQYAVQCEDCGWSGETAKIDKETGKQLKRKVTI